MDWKPKTARQGGTTSNLDLYFAEYVIPLLGRIILGTMIQRVYLVRCPNCPDPIVLPRQSRLGRFEGQQRRPTGVWPITYLCTQCGRWSVLSADMFHPQAVEGQVQGPPRESLYRYEFSSDHERSVRLHYIYRKGLLRASADELVNSLLRPSGTWKEEYGQPRFEGALPLPY